MYFVVTYLLPQRFTFLASKCGISFEQSSILFNIASLYSQLANSENRNTEEGFKKAAVYLQQSAGVLEYLSTCLNEWGVSEKGSAQLGALLNLMLAQAQNMFLQKSIKGKMKDLTISKLAKSAADFYQLAHDKAEQAGDFEKEFLAFSESKVAHMRAISHFYKGKDNFSNGAYGEQISRCNLAISILKSNIESKSSKHSPTQLKDEMKQFQQSIESALPPLIKDNDVVYMQSVPKLDDLTEVEAIVMSKCTPFPELSSLKDIAGPPLFEKLVSYEVYEAIEEYNKQKEKLVTNLELRINDTISLASSILTSLNLPGSLEAFEQPLGLPSSILQKSEELKREGGPSRILELFSTLGELASMDSSILKESIRVIDMEEKQDNEIRYRFKERWQRVPSEQLNKNFREAFNSFQEKLTVATKSDDTVRKKWDDNIPWIEILCSTKEDLEASIPASSPQSTVMSKNPNAKILRDLLNKLTELHSKMNQIKRDLSELQNNDDMTTTFMEESSKSSEFNPEPIYKQGLSKYDLFIQKVDVLRDSQDAILKALHETHKKFSGTKEATSLISEREQAFKNLDNGYRFYKEIFQNLQEGIKFYNDFQNILCKFQNNCNDFVFARDLDKKETLERLQLSLSSLQLNDSQTLSRSPGQAHHPGEWNRTTPFQYRNANERQR